MGVCHRSPLFEIAFSYSDHNRRCKKYADYSRSRNRSAFNLRRVSTPVVESARGVVLSGHRRANSRANLILGWLSLCQSHGVAQLTICILPPVAKRQSTVFLVPRPKRHARCLRVRHHRPGILITHSPLSRFRLCSGVVYVNLPKGRGGIVQTNMMYIAPKTRVGATILG